LKKTLGRKGGTKKSEKKQRTPCPKGVWVKLTPIGGWGEKNIWGGNVKTHPDGGTTGGKKSKREGLGAENVLDGVPSRKR